jgi:hypothetical protein
MSRKTDSTAAAAAFARKALTLFQPAGPPQSMRDEELLPVAQLAALVALLDLGERIYDMLDTIDSRIIDLELKLEAKGE